MADYLVYELHADGTARRLPSVITADHDAAAYIEAAKIASAEEAIIEVWLENVLVWHLEPPPGRRNRAGLTAGLCPGAV